MGNVALSSARLWSHYFLSLLLGWVVYSWKWHHSIFQPFDNIRLRVSPLPISPHLLIIPISHSSFHFCLFLHFSPPLYISSLLVLFLFLLLISLLPISSHILFTIFSPSISLSHLSSSSLLLFFSSPLLISPLPVSLWSFLYSFYFWLFLLFSPRLYFSSLLFWFLLISLLLGTLSISNTLLVSPFPVSPYLISTPYLSSFSISLSHLCY